MKTRIALLALSLLFYFPSFAQQEEPVNTKKGAKTQNQEVNYAPLDEPLPIDDFTAGGGGYPAYFYYGDPTNDQMYKLEAYYSRKNNESGERFSPSRKDIPLVLLDHQEELSRFLKENKLNLKDQDDLVKLFTYYNSLD